MKKRRLLTSFAATAVFGACITPLMSMTSCFSHDENESAHGFSVEASEYSILSDRTVRIRIKCDHNKDHVHVLRNIVLKLGSLPISTVIDKSTMYGNELDLTFENVQMNQRKKITANLCFELDNETEPVIINNLTIIDDNAPPSPPTPSEGFNVMQPSYGFLLINESFNMTITSSDGGDHTLSDFELSIGDIILCEIKGPISMSEGTAIVSFDNITYFLPNQQSNNVKLVFYSDSKKVEISNLTIKAPGFSYTLTSETVFNPSYSSLSDTAYSKEQAATTWFQALKQNPYMFIEEIVNQADYRHAHELRDDEYITIAFLLNSVNLETNCLSFQIIYDEVRSTSSKQINLTFTNVKFKFGLSSQNLPTFTFGTTTELLSQEQIWSIKGFIIENETKTDIDWNKDSTKSQIDYDIGTVDNLITISNVYYFANVNQWLEIWTNDDWTFQESPIETIPMRYIHTGEHKLFLKSGYTYSTTFKYQWNEVEDSTMVLNLCYGSSKRLSFNDFNSISLTVGTTTYKGYHPSGYDAEHVLFVKSFRPYDWYLQDLTLEFNLKKDLTDAYMQFMHVKGSF